MKYANGNASELKNKFWQSMSDSPFIMLQLEGDSSSAAPMTAQLDKDANSAIWFFTQKNGTFAKLGRAAATYEGKGHGIFARFHGNLTVETSKERLNQHWSNFAEAWFEGGKTDPNLLFVRMDLGAAEIWDGDIGLMNSAKMAFGMTVDVDPKEQHAKTIL